MSNPRVVFINRFFFPDESATSQILSELAFDLARDDNGVVVVTSRQMLGKPGRTLPKREKINGVQIVRAWSTRFGGHSLLGRAVDYLTFYVGAGFELWRLTDQHAILVAKTDPPLLSSLVAAIARMKHARLVNWLQDVFPEVAHALGVRGVSGPFLQLLIKARNKSLLAAKTNVVLGSRMHSFLRTQGIPSQQLQIIHNWADGDAIKPKPARENPLRTDWDLQDKFVIGYSGNFGRAHEFNTIVEAAELLANNAQITFLMIGGGAQLARLENHIRDRGLLNFQFRPFQPKAELANSLTVPDVHLVTLNPALEGLIVPSKFYGIAAAGRPTVFVGDPTGEVAAILAAHGCGASVGTGDSAGLAKLLQRLADDEDARLQMGQNARAAFEHTYDRRHALKSWRTVLR